MVRFHWSGDWKHSLIWLRWWNRTHIRKMNYPTNDDQSVRRMRSCRRLFGLFGLFSSECDGITCDMKWLHRAAVRQRSFQMLTAEFKNDWLIEFRLMIYYQSDRKSSRWRETPRPSRTAARYAEKLRTVPSCDDDHARYAMLNNGWLDNTIADGQTKSSNKYLINETCADAYSYTKRRRWRWEDPSLGQLPVSRTFSHPCTRTTLRTNAKII